MRSKAHLFLIYSVKVLSASQQRALTRKRHPDLWLFLPSFHAPETKKKALLRHMDILGKGVHYVSADGVRRMAFCQSNRHLTPDFDSALANIRHQNIKCDRLGLCCSHTTWKLMFIGPTSLVLSQHSLISFLLIYVILYPQQGIVHARN